MRLSSTITLAALGRAALAPQRLLALYGRHESSDPNAFVSGDATSRIVLGGICSLTVPEYLRRNVEHSLRAPQFGPSTHNLAAGLTLAF